jgi:Uma2 family endonuclease
MAANPTRLMTVEEFRELPEETGDFYYELHHGELVRVTRPKLKHIFLQSRLRELLQAVAPAGGFVEIELPFRAVPEFELRAADVAFVSRERIGKADPEDDFHGAPDIVIEVLSPSNTAREMLEKEALCLENGCREFWVVDEKTRQIRISTADGRVTTYKPGQMIPLALFGTGELAVDSIFS